MPSRPVGKYQCDRFDDLIAFKKMDDIARARFLDQLTVASQALEIGHGWSIPSPLVYAANILGPVMVALVPLILWIECRIVPLIG